MLHSSELFATCVLNRQQDRLKQFQQSIPDRNKENKKNLGDIKSKGVSNSTDTTEFQEGYFANGTDVLFH